MNIYFKNKNGAALIIVLMAFTVMFIFGVSALFISSNSLHQIKDDRAETTAEYIARSGLDAAVEYLKSTDGSFSGETLPTVYCTKAGVFQLGAPASSDLLGKADTTIAYNSTTGICSVTTIGEANGETYTTKAVSTPIRTESHTGAQDQHSNNRWFYYFYESGNWLFWSYEEKHYYFAGTRNNQVSFIDADGNSRLMSYHSFDGIVQINTPGNAELELAIARSSEAHRRVGYGARAIFMNCPIKLQYGLWNSTWYALDSGNVPNMGDPGVLILSAERIIFKNRVRFMQNGSGTLMLNLPDGYGISGEKVYFDVADGPVSNPNLYRSKVNTSAVYGKVYFSQVEVSNTTPGVWNPTFSASTNLSNKSFYFRMNPAKPNDGLPIDFYYDTTGTANDVDCRYATLINNGFLIPAKTSPLPDPMDLLDFKFVE